ncbi:pheromone processing endoprotease [Coemansia erecta]|uniref:Pheromone processing endoprotease n=1 Tax=Coemansia erecta TaxID=147472 RepID=A0A9W7Y3C4_9FUNG|nr:pheromone processing endoprotease [Coemansia erecta]
MRVGVLAVAAAAWLHLALVRGRDSSMVSLWRRQAELEPPAVPHAQSDPAYDYAAVKFNSDGASIDLHAAEYAAHSGWENVGQLGALTQYRVFRRLKTLRRRSADEPAVALAAVAHVTELRQNRRLHKRDGWPPASNDTAWHEIGDPLFAQQWHLVNTQEPGHDVNVTGVWRAGVSGAGVTVALIDDGLDYSSEDLLANFDYAGSYDFNDRTKLPTPRLADDYHGTRCAGQIAAARNTVCGVGVAYGARVAGIRMLSREVSDQDEVGALNYAMDRTSIYSCSWGPNDDGATVQGPGRVVEDAFVAGVERGRQGRGSVFVFATGNGGAAGDNCNFDGYTNSIYTISIGAIDHADRHPYYSEQCSAQLAVTYSNGDSRGIVTTDLGLRACTSKHGGTSAAAPLAAGIFALALSVRPDLTWRDLQHVAVRAAVPVDAGDADWAPVAQGRRYNHKYGFGKMDAGRIVAEARAFAHVGRQTRIDVARDRVELPIPVLAHAGGESDALVRAVEVTRAQVEAAKMVAVEHVTVAVDMAHQFRGNVEIWLESPAGARSQLATTRPRDASGEGLKGWRFMSVKHWDEDPVGTWTLHVRNALKAKYAGRLLGWQLTVFGQSSEPDPAANGTLPAVPEPEPVPGEGASETGGSSSRTPGPTGTSLPDGAGPGGTVRKSTAVLVSVLLFGAGAVVSALGVVFYMCRRERHLSEARWTALDSMDDGAFGLEGPRRRFVVDRPEDHEDAGVFEFADVEEEHGHVDAGDGASGPPGVDESQRLM